MRAVRLLCAAALTAAIAAGAAPVAQAARPPVVLIVFDEFPVDDIVAPGGGIDAERFPGFAALARTSTWFPNGYSVYDSTPKAAPAITAGTLPKVGLDASYRDHPTSVFTLLRRNGWKVNALEEVTRVCPPSICPRRGTYGRVRYNILHRRKERLDRTIASLHRSRRAVFTFHHTMLPHVPWSYLPSGRAVQVVRPGRLPDFKAPPGFGDAELTQHNQQRHLQQVGFVDRKIGRLVRRLRRTGLLRKALVVVTADHGFSFEVGVADRRSVTESNVDEVAPVPLFVKLPRQTRGSVSRAYASTVDILPTIAEALDLRLEAPVDGRSVFSRTVRARPGVSIVSRDFSHTITVPAREMEARRADNVARRTAVFGSGAWRLIYLIGPHPELLGRSVRDLAVDPFGREFAGFAVPRRLSRVDPRGATVPTWAAGRIANGAPGAERDLALSVNGTVRAMGRSFHLRNSPAEWFSLMLPESTLVRGSNSMDLFEVRRSGAALRLVPLGGVR